MLVDTAEIEIRAGRGGDGAVSWRREKHVPRGGPDGGDGGRGGNVYLKASNDVDTLSSFRFRKSFQAEDGERGMGKKKTGAGGEDLTLLVPTGTIIYEQPSGRVITDMEKSGEIFRIAKGGKGGLGNVHFASATHQNPMEATPGQEGEYRQVRLELRLVADIALVGEPNAGKSSLLKALTGADVRIGDFAFSTTQPSLGVLKLGDKHITLVDLPGLLEGAHTGKGLGDKFLRHVMRVKALLHVVDGTSNIKDSIRVIEGEISQYHEYVSNLPKQLVVNKIDLLNSDELTKLKKEFPEAIYVSASTSEHLDDLKTYLASLPLDKHAE